MAASFHVADCTVSDHGHGCDTLVWDPPWDADILPVGGFERYDSVLAFGDGRRAGDVVTMLGAPTWMFVWDCVSSWYTRNRPLQRYKVCLWYGDVGRWDEDAFFLNKGNPTRKVRNTRGEHTAGDTRGVRMSDLYSHPITSLHSGANTHRHSKPIDWITYLIACTGSARVYDPCCGSGSTAVACKRIGIDCVCCDIDEQNVIESELAYRGNVPNVGDAQIRMWE